MARKKKEPASIQVGVLGEFLERMKKESGAEQLVLGRITEFVKSLTDEEKHILRVESESNILFGPNLLEAVMDGLKEDDG